MRSSSKILFVFMASIILAGCASSSKPRGPTPSALSRQLKEHDSEQQVIKKMGYQPNKVEMVGCGPDRSVLCKSYYYSWDGETLLIIFVKNKVITSLKVPVDQLPRDPNLIDSSHATFEYEWMVASWSVFNYRM